MSAKITGSVPAGLALGRGVRRFADWQRRWSRTLDCLLPKAMAVDGNDHFRASILPRLIKPGMTICDVGGGARPYISSRERARLQLKVVGLDIDQEELGRAPLGSYDRTLCADLTRYCGDGAADLVICQATLEHVEDIAAAVEALASIARPGGTVAIFVPCRNAAFARLNLLLPEWLKRRLLGLLAENGGHAGFPAHYDRCTPFDIEAITALCDLQVIERHLFWRSGYFEFCAPLHALWRLWTLFAYHMPTPQCCETFAIVAVRR